jgi:hypothetical protein
MKKLLISTSLVISNILMFAAVTPKAIPEATVKPTKNETFSYSFNTFQIHNLGTQPVKLNSISVLFSIGAAKPKPYQLTYKKSIKKGKIGKIPNAKIQFSYPAGTQVNYSGISEININNNQIITISNPGDYDIYVTNQGNVWKETTKPEVLTPKAKNISAKIAPSPKNNSELAKTTTPAAKTATLKAAAIVVKNKAKMPQPQSKAAKAINTAILPKAAVIKPEITQ